MPSNKLTQTEKTTPNIFNAEALISKAIENNVPVETMERLLNMRRDLKAEWAKEEFDKAMSGFQFECPIIAKTKAVKTSSGTVAYKFTPIEELDAQTKALREKYGFSYRTNQRMYVENGITTVEAIVKVTHKAGHSEDTSMTVPLGNKTNVMSQSQVVAAAYTFAKRYAFKNAFGINEADEDNEALLRRADQDVEIPQEMVNKLNGAETLEDLAKVGKELADQNPKLVPALRLEYTRRKNELSEQLAEDVDKGLKKEEQSHDNA